MQGTDNPFVNLTLCQGEKSLAIDILVLGSYIAAIYAAWKVIDAITSIGASKVIGLTGISGYYSTVGGYIIQLGALYLLHMAVRKGYSDCNLINPQEPDNSGGAEA